MIEKKSKKKHATNSFAHFMSEAQLKALKPYIEQQVAMQGRIITQRVAQVLLESVSNIQIRQLALEELLINNTPITKETLAFQITEQEDKALGYETVEEAQVGDLIRISVSSKEVGAENFGDVEKLRINSLGKEVEGRVQTLKELEDAIVGMRAGESKEVKTKSVEGEKDMILKVEVVKISRKKEKKEDE